MEFIVIEVKHKSLPISLSLSNSGTSPIVSVLRRRCRRLEPQREVHRCKGLPLTPKDLRLGPRRRSSVDQGLKPTRTIPWDIPLEWYPTRNYPDPQDPEFHWFSLPRHPVPSLDTGFLNVFFKGDPIRKHVKVSRTESGQEWWSDPGEEDGDENGRRNERLTEGLDILLVSKDFVSQLT